MPGKSKVKYIQSLGQKKFREQYGEFIAEGPKVAAEFILSQQYCITGVYGIKKWLEANEEILTKDMEVAEVSEDELKRMSQLSTPNEVLVVMTIPVSRQVVSLKNKLSLALDAIRDPGNMGTIIRIADWFGIENIFCSKDSAEIYNPKVVQASMGSIIRTNVVYTDIPELLQKNDAVNSYAAALNGKDIRKIEKPQEGIIIIGNESKGISKEIMDLATIKITIPGRGGAESLNAAVATGIILSYFV